VTVRHEGFTGCDEAAYEHAEGWERVLGWLDHYLYMNFISRRIRGKACEAQAFLYLFQEPFFFHLFHHGIANLRK